MKNKCSLKKMKLLKIIQLLSFVMIKVDLRVGAGFPLRIRYDKTAEYRLGYKNYGNAYHVAQS